MSHRSKQTQLFTSTTNTFATVATQSTCFFFGQFDPLSFSTHGCTVHILRIQILSKLKNIDQTSTKLSLSFYIKFLVIDWFLWRFTQSCLNGLYITKCTNPFQEENGFFCSISKRFSVLLATFPTFFLRTRPSVKQRYDGTISCESPLNRCKACKAGATI